MPTIITNPIESGDVGSEWYNKVNTNTTNIVSALASCTEIGHRHMRNDITDFFHTHTVSHITDFANQTYTGDKVIVSHEGESKTVQEAIGTIQSYIEGLVVSAVINNITFLGEGSDSSIVTAVIGLSAAAFGLFTIKWVWSNTSSTPDFSSAPVMTGMNSQIFFPKPSTGYVNNQQYLHLRVVFTNASNTSGIAANAYALVTKWAKDVTAQEIADLIVGTPSFMQAVASDIASRRSFRSDIATRVNDI